MKKEKKSFPNVRTPLGIGARIPGGNSKGFLATIPREDEPVVHLRGQVKAKVKVEKDGVLQQPAP